MSQLQQHHNETDSEGVGRCSVPMWQSGGPAGFCDRPAYGKRPNAAVHRRWDGFEWRDDGRYAGYVPGLACVHHGGPNSRVFMDGDAWCAVFPDFINLQESPSGFGATPEEARIALATGAKP